MDHHEHPSQDRPVAVVTGAARGIGRAIVRQLVDDDWSVVGADLHLPATSDPVRDAHTSWRCADVTVEADVVELFREAVARFGRVDGLVNNAALTDVHRDWRTVTEQDWQRVMDVNLSGAFRCCRLAAPLLCRSSRGRIVNIGSITFATGQRNLVDYVSTKGGLVGLTHALARELGPDGVTVNTVTPGAIQTEAELEMFPDQAAVERDALRVQAIPRRGQPHDIAAAVSFLMSTSAGFITGQSLHVDGGWILS